MLLVQQTNKSKSGLWIALVIVVVPILFVAFTVVMAGVLYLWASDLAVEQESNRFSGNVVQQRRYDDALPQTALLTSPLDSSLNGVLKERI